MTRTWIILKTLNYYDEPQDVAQDARSVQAVLSGPAKELADVPRVKVRRVTQSTAMEVHYVVRADDELGASQVADRVRDMLMERAFSRTIGFITFGRPIGLDG